jgi:hypothetical protein
VGPVFELGPEGTQFSVPVTVAIPYTAAEFGNVSPGDFIVSTIVGGVWQPDSNPTFDTQAGTVSGQQTHFSTVGVVPLVCPAPTPPAGGLWDFYSYVFTPGPPQSPMTSDPSVGTVWGEVIVYGPGTNPSGTSVCGALAALSFGTTGDEAIAGADASDLATNYAAADVVLNDGQANITTTQATGPIAWSTTSITSMDLVLAPASDWPERLTDSWVSAGEFQHVISGSWLFNAHWQSVWPDVAPQPTRILPPGISQPPTAPASGPPFADPPPDEPSLPNAGCDTGQATCVDTTGTVCTTLATDANNCGICGRQCAGGVSGPDCCGGGCTDFQTDPTSCGGCGVLCSTSEQCSSGKCCINGYTNCSGVCVNEPSDPNNCGACGHVCGSGMSCSSGTCINGCTGPQTLCGGACVDLSSSSSNCGVCGAACSLLGASTCAGSVCSCPSTTTVTNLTIVTPASPIALLGNATLSLQATATVNGVPGVDVTNLVQWSPSSVYGASSSVHVAAMVSPGGVVTGASPGSSTVTASLCGVSSASLTLYVPCSTGGAPFAAPLDPNGQCLTPNSCCASVGFGSDQPLSIGCSSTGCAAASGSPTPSLVCSEPGVVCPSGTGCILAENNCSCSLRYAIGQAEFLSVCDVAGAPPAPPSKPRLVCNLPNGPCPSGLSCTACPQGVACAAGTGMCQ